MCQIAAKCSYHFHLLFGLYAFGNDFEARRLTQRDHCLHDTGVSLRLRQALEEGLINFEGLYGKLCQLTKRRVAGTEVVDMNAYNIFRQILQHRPGNRRILEQHRLRQFEIV